MGWVVVVNEGTEQRVRVGAQQAPGRWWVGKQRDGAALGGGRDASPGAGGGGVCMERRAK